MNDSVRHMLAKEPNRLLQSVISILIVIGLLYFSAGSVEYNQVQSSGIAIAQNILRGIFSPDIDFLLTLSKQGVPYLLLETISIAFLGTIIGAILSIPLAFLSSSTLVPRWISTIGLTLIAIIRTFPALVYGLMFIRVTGPGPFTGVLTLSVVSIGMISKLYIEAIEALDSGIVEALNASGATSFQKIRFGILPQLTSSFLSTAIYRFEINIKNASVLGLVGAGGIGAPLIFAMSAYRWGEVGAILVGLILIVIVVEFYSSRIRKRLS